MLGNDNITFTGLQFPHELEGSVFDLKFNDLAQTPCVVQSSEAAKLVCLTSPFDRSETREAATALTIIINGVTATYTDTFTFRAEVTSGSTITPDSVSPVLKT